MDEKVQQKWLDLGYDQEKIPGVVKKLEGLQHAPENAILATPTDVNNLFRLYLGGLVLFSGRVTAKSGFTVVLEDEQICITTCKVDEERSLYIHPFEKKIRDLDAFYLIIRDFRKNQVASFEFRKEGGMLYVPKK